MCTDGGLCSESVVHGGTEKKVEHVIYEKICSVMASTVWIQRKFC